MEMRLLRETRSVLEYLHERIPTISGAHIHEQGTNIQLSDECSTEGDRTIRQQVQVQVNRDIRAGEPVPVLWLRDGKRISYGIGTSGISGYAQGMRTAVSRM
jgi:hypothetical protein